jgi:hypothetical protein
MTHEPDVFGYLATSKISEITAALLDDSTKHTFAAKKNVKFWKGPISIWATVRASRTYPAGLPIPETGACVTQAIGATETVSFQPSGTEVWQVLGIAVTAAAGTPTVNVFLTDGGTPCAMHSGTSSTTASSFFPFEAPFTISNTLYLMLVNTDGANAVNATLAYSKVSL